MNDNLDLHSAEGDAENSCCAKNSRGEMSANGIDRNALLKSYLERLRGGEDLESVRRDFAEHFQNVDAAEIMRAEQELMAAGVPIETVTKLCDVHSALFHGATREEKIAGAERAVAASLEAEKSESRANAEKAAANADKTKFAALASEAGHPLNILTMENEAIQNQIDNIKKLLAEEAAPETLLPEVEKFRAVADHYRKKGDLLFPQLESKYGIDGPSRVMWTVDVEIRESLKRLSRELAAFVQNKNAADENQKTFAAWKEDFNKTRARAEEMIYKEANILFPICASHFSKAEWIQMRRDFDDYPPCLIDSFPKWEKAQEGAENPSGRPNAIVGNYESEGRDAHDGETARSKNAAGITIDATAGSGVEINFPTGRMNLEQLAALLNTIPVEISFVDDDDVNRYFNEGEKVFKRPSMALGRKVWTCHPVQMQPMVKKIIADFKSGAKDSVEVWHPKKDGEPMLVRYMALRGKDGAYLGTAEFAQKMGIAKAYFERAENR